MFRILFFVFLIFLVWLVVRMLGASRKRAAPAPDAPDGREAPKSVEVITQCAWCGVHVPHGDAVALPDGRIYCSVAHRDAAEVAAPVDRNSRP